MAAFLFLQALLGFLQTSSGTSLARTAPQYWIYPIQTVVAGALLLWYWRDFAFHPPVRISWVILVGIGVFGLWIAPQVCFGVAPRRDGFNPELFVNQPALYWPTISLRFLRLVVVVPLIEEIFWRGFLLRYLISDKFNTVPVGSFSWFSFAVVSVAFGFSHAQADWLAAILTGMAYNIVAYRTKSLASSVLTHALTNLMLGLWIMKTGQWGFW